MSNLGDVKRSLAGTTACQLGGLDTINQALDIVVVYDKTAADGMATTTTSDTVIWTNPYDFTVYLVSGKYIGLGSGLTADPSNNATIAIKTNDGAGGSTSTALSVTTSAADGGTWTSNQSKSFTTTTAANIAVPSGGCVWFNIAKGGTGVVVPISRYTLRLKKGE